MTRAFVAVALPAAALDAVAARVESLAIPAAGRVATREQWHITVQFLGDDADIDAVSSAFAAAPLELGVGELQLGGAVVFGNARRARILAIGLGRGTGWMRELAARVGERVVPLGYARDPGERFRPHLTIARFRVPTDLRMVRDSIGTDAVGAPFAVEEIVLFESILERAGARHVPRARIPVRDAVVPPERS